MANLHERWGVHFQTRIYVKGRSGVSVNLAQAFQALQKIAGKEGSALYEPKPPEEFRTITALKHVDFKTIPGKVVMLFAHIDTHMSSLLGHEKTLTLREPDRQPEEHGASTAHLVINLTQTADGSHGTILEEADGLSASRIALTLNALLRDHVKLSWEKRPGKILMPTLRMQKVADVSFAKDLASGELTMLALSRKPTADELAAMPASPPKEFRMAIHLPASVSGQGALASVMRVVRSPFASDYPKLHVGYRDKDGKHHTAVEDLTPGQDKLTDLIHRKTKLPRFSQALPVDPATVVKPLAEALAHLLDVTP